MRTSKRSWAALGHATARSAEHAAAGTEGWIALPTSSLTTSSPSRAPDRRPAAHRPLPITHRPHSPHQPSSATTLRRQQSAFDHPVEVRSWATISTS
jgi:hypothetical protein